MSNSQDPPIVISGGIEPQQYSVPGAGPILNGVLWQLHGTLPPGPPIIISDGNAEP